MPEGAKSKKNKKNKAAAKAKEEVGNKNTENGHLEENTENQSDEEAPESNPQGTPAASINGKSVSNIATERTASNEDDDSDGESAATTKNDTQQQAKSDAEPPALDAQSKDRFDALVRDRDSLRAEVTDMRKSLEEIQSRHREDMEALRQRVDDAESKKGQAETQYQKLLERVNTIKAQLGERLKEDAEEIAQARSQIEDLEEQNSNLTTELDSKSSELAEIAKENEEKAKEIVTLRDRTNLSQQNWLKERDELLEQESYIQAEFEQAKEAMHNWEVLAMEERSIRESLGEKVIDLEEQLVNLKDAYEKAASERDNQSSTVDGLQRALQEIQTARKQELRELVESSDAQLEELRQSLRDADNKSSEAEKSLLIAQEELERVRPFEKEVKEKNLLIGKLRHEAVTLNDHLTKALRFLKKGKPEDNVDRHIVTNHLLHFLALDRSDPKKFQILQLIAALLGWTDEQREQAGLARPGTSNTSNKLRVPGTPVRTPSTPTLATEFMDNGTSHKESLAELWSNFLEQESQAGNESAAKSGNQGQSKS
ncbi:hypothetical protein SI65_02542 [Aspergillus cristatus]|uniref:GRIP domain-containing protein n=1 Tax=Aspergillus cristatus TaxID=573508 RepID=A0A1E3BLB0_ASPCR|nr:hypothetical protein SI65_02542 [Aspergillus cristatus]